MKKSSISIVLILLFIICFSQLVQALPTFSRKYETSCSTCHVAIPKLTAFGESFRLNGYQIPEGDEEYLKEKPVSLGATPWKKVWPDAIWPGAIPGSFPLSAFIMSDVNQPLEGEEKEMELEFPHEVEIFMAGTMGDDVPFFAEVEIEEGEVEAEAWVGFYNVFNSDRRTVNFRIGSFEINPLPVAFDHLRLSKTHYLYNNWRMPGSENRFRLRGGKPGFEINGILGSGFYYSAGLVDPEGGFDSYGTIRFKLGGTPFDRSAPTEEATKEAIGVKPTGFWIDNSFELAAFAYFGRAHVIGEVKDSFNRYGIGARWNYQNLHLSGGYLIGENKDPYGRLSAQSVDSRTWFVEANYYIFPWLIAEARYESLELDEPTDYRVTDIDQTNVIVGLSWTIRANIRLITEATLYTKGVGKTDIFNVRLVFGF
ncbi:MAG: hypothetical protein AB1410_11580 [Acidobacteriota bacterium]